MDIWQWVQNKKYDLYKANKYALYQYMQDIVQKSRNLDHIGLQTIYPSALAEARRLDEIEVELYIRHWYLQNKILQSLTLNETITEIISLVELSNRISKSEYPQSNDAIHDLLNMYVNSNDIGSELFEAFLENADYHASCLFFEAMQREIINHKSIRSENTLIYTRTSFLKNQGKLDEALTLLQQVKNKNTQDYQKHKHTLKTAEIYCLKNMHEKALNYLTPYNQILITPSNYLLWFKIHKSLIKKKSTTFGLEFIRKSIFLADTLFYNGSFRASIYILSQICELAIDNTFLTHALIALKALQRHPQHIPEIGQTCQILQNKLDKTYSNHIKTTKPITEKFDIEAYLTLKKIQDNPSEQHIIQAAKVLIKLKFVEQSLTLLIENLSDKNSK